MPACAKHVVVEPKETIQLFNIKLLRSAIIIPNKATYFFSDHGISQGLPPLRHQLIK